MTGGLRLPGQPAASARRRWLFPPPGRSTRRGRPRAQPPRPRWPTAPAVAARRLRRAHRAAVPGPDVTGRCSSQTPPGCCSSRSKDASRASARSHRNRQWPPRLPGRLPRVPHRFHAIGPATDPRRCRVLPGDQPPHRAPPSRWPLPRPGPAAVVEAILNALIEASLSSIDDKSARAAATPPERYVNRASPSATASSTRIPRPSRFRCRCLAQSTINGSGSLSDPHLGTADQQRNVGGAERRRSRQNPRNPWNGKNTVALSTKRLAAESHSESTASTWTAATSLRV